MSTNRDKVTFKWTEQCEQAYNSLKTHLTSAPTLALPDWSWQFILDTDTSDNVIGAVLSQLQLDGTDHAICYASWIHTKPKRNYCVTLKELLAVVFFLQHFRQYPFILQTDHGTLT